MPPVHASTWPRPPQWRETLDSLCAPRSPHNRVSRPASATAIARIRGAAPAWIEDQATSMLQARATGSSTPPLRRSSWRPCKCTGRRSPARFAAAEVRALDVPGLCPLCGTLPVASIVCAHSPYQGYRYLHCALCATEWHMVRSALHVSAAPRARTSLTSRSKADTADETMSRTGDGGRARGDLRAMPWLSQDPLSGKGSRGRPLADDLASLALDLLLGEQGYHRASSNPLLWLPNATGHREPRIVARAGHADIPSLDRLLNDGAFAALLARYSRTQVTAALRCELGALRQRACRGGCCLQPRLAAARRSRQMSTRACSGARGRGCVPVFNLTRHGIAYQSWARALLGDARGAIRVCMR